MIRSLGIQNFSPDQLRFDPVVEFIAVTSEKNEIDRSQMAFIAAFF